MKLEHSILSAKQTIKGCRWLPTCILFLSFIHSSMFIYSTTFVQRQTRYRNKNETVELSYLPLETLKLPINWLRNNKNRTWEQKQNQHVEKMGGKNVSNSQRNSRLNIIPQEKATLTSEEMNESVCLCVCWSVGAWEGFFFLFISHVGTSTVKSIKGQRILNGPKL